MATAANNEPAARVLAGAARDGHLTGSTLELIDVGVRFGGVVALDGVSFEVRPGEVVGLIGPNGAGKSTLLNVVAGVVRPSSGEVRCFGRRANAQSTVARAKSGIARTFQTLSLLREMTVHQHVLFGYLAAIRPSLRLGWYGLSRSALVRRADADTSPLAPHALLERFGLLDVADELAVEQSVGTARMVDLARAMAMRPRLLLLDEPVSGLSESEARAVAAILADIRADHHMSIVVVEHNMDFARLVSDRMVALDFGAVIAAGPCDDVLGSPILQRAYFGLAEDETTADAVGAAPFQATDGTITSTTLS